MYLDKLIKSGELASYGHSLRKLLHFRKYAGRLIERQKREIIVLKTRISGYEYLLKEKGVVV